MAKRRKQDADGPRLFEAREREAEKRIRKLRAEFMRLSSNKSIPS